MFYSRSKLVACLLIVGVACPWTIPIDCLRVARGQDQHADHGSSKSSSSSKRAAPTVFLDKSPRIVEYQLKRLNNQRLLQVERKTDHKKYIPVYAAILTRVGMSPQQREEAIEALVKLRESDSVSILLEAIDKFDANDREQGRSAEQLAGTLLQIPTDDLRARLDTISDATDEANPLVRSAAFAALVMANENDRALNHLERSDDAKLAFLNSVEWIPSDERRVPLREPIVRMLNSSDNDSVRRAAVKALGFIRETAADNFELVAPLFNDPELRDQAVRTLLRIPVDQRDDRKSTQLVKSLVAHAENTPAKDRTSDAFIDAMQLADQLLARLPSADARSLRRRLDAVTVRVVRIRTVEEEMRYDTSYFAVQAGKSVQIILENHDLMPHNLVITTPGSLKAVAQLGLEVGPTGGSTGLAYVPESDKVLFATDSVPSDQQARLTFDAPQEPGEYPYVCTFPQHWYRMYGVMVVVEDLDAWLKDPVEPANPIGSNRSFVRAWQVEDLESELESGLRGRTPEIGKRLFAEASCAGCHQVQGEGGILGPNLTDVVTRWKGNQVGVLREILEPSHKVDEKYVMQKILTVDGQTITGILTAEDDDNVTLLASPDAKEPLVLPQDDIEAMIPSSVSMMPKALLDQYTKDEIFELLAYLQSVDPGTK